MKCYHVTTKDRLWAILCNGLRPNSKPNWFKSRTPYIMLSRRSFFGLYDLDKEVYLEISDPNIKPEYFDNPEGLRWPFLIKPRYIKIMTFAHILVHHLADLREKAQKEKANPPVRSRKDYVAKRNGYIQAIDHSIGVILKCERLWS